jgi:predicted pyridoxine 5'-phosphate oxidase superfamily flavin-nucleotide-binding protein
MQFRGLEKPLTEQQIREFLERSKLNLQLGTVDDKGEPTFIPFGTFLKMIVYTQ